MVIRNFNHRFKHNGKFHKINSVLYFSIHTQTKNVCDNLRKLIEIISKKSKEKSKSDFKIFLCLGAFACVYNIEMIKLFLNAVIIRLLNGNLLAAH